MSLSGTTGSVTDGAAGGATQVEITTSPIKIELDSSLSLNKKYETRDAFMLDMAAKLYCNMNHSDAQSAKDNAEKAIRFAKVFWNTAQGWYTNELISDGKKGGKYQFNSNDKP